MTKFSHEHNDAVAAKLQAVHPGVTGWDVARKRQEALAKLREQFPEMPEGDMEAVAWLKERTGT